MEVAKYALLTLVLLACVSGFSAVSTKEGFTVNLIHRDSPRSPFYNPSETPSQRLKNAFRRSIERLGHFNSSMIQPNQAESTIVDDGASYVMELSIGTPPVPIKAIADTGSDLIWTQCQPCVDCYPQTEPPFDPSKSSTYRTIPCSSRKCGFLGGNCPPTGRGPCQYHVRYGDRSETKGDYAADTVTLASTTGGNISFPKTLFGCGHVNSGTFDKKESGIVGLGGGDESLISQLDSFIHGKFAYCFIPWASEDHDKTSKLSFGDNAVVSGSSVMSTPLVSRPFLKTFFYLKLEAISVDGTKIPFSSFSSSPSPSPSGNIIIDSGTTLTFLDKSFYSALEDAVVDKVVGGERVTDPLYPTLLCYKVSESEDLKTPNITVHFSGANVELEEKNTFARLSEELMCFAFAPSNSFSIYGNVAQSGFLVGYDLKGKTVSFKPTDCTNF